jgi:hypothetical protein
MAQRLEFRKQTAPLGFQEAPELRAAAAGRVAPGGPPAGRRWATRIGTSTGAEPGGLARLARGRAPGPRGG